MKKEKRNKLIRRVSSMDLIESYINKLKEHNILITDIQIDFNEQQQIDIKIKGKEIGE